MKKQFFQRTIVVVLVALLCCFLWGSAFPFTKLGYQWMRIASEDSASLILFAGVRFTIAGILVILIGSFLQKKFLIPERKNLGGVCVLAIFQTILQYVFFFIGVAHTSGVNSSIIISTNVFFSVLMACYLFRQESMTARKFVGCFIGLLGVILVNLSGGSLSGISLNGEGFVFLAALSAALSGCFIKIYSQKEDPVTLSGYQFLLGGLFMALIGLAFGGRIYLGQIQCILILGWLSMVSAVAYSLWGILLKYNPVSRVSVFGFMNPVFGVILSALILGEGSIIRAATILALIMVCIGIYVCNKEPD